MIISLFTIHRGQTLVAEVHAPAGNDDAALEACAAELGFASAADMTCCDGEMRVTEWSLEGR